MLMVVFVLFYESIGSSVFKDQTLQLFGEIGCVLLSGPEAARVTACLCCQGIND